MSLRTLARTVCLSVFALWLLPCSAQVVVVVGSNSKVVALTADQVADIYLGRLNAVGRDLKLLPLEQTERALKEDFHRRFTGKTPNQLRAHWAKLVFAGQDNPPAEVPSTTALKDLLAKDARLIGYMDSSDVDASVRVVLTATAR